MDILHRDAGFDEAILQQYYGYFKQKPIERVVEAALNVLQIQPHPHLAAHLQASSTTVSTLRDDWETMDQYRVNLANQNVTWDKYLEDSLQVSLLRTSHVQLLHVCILTLDNKEFQTLFSFVQKTWASYRIRLDDLYLTPVRIIVQHIARAWDMQSLLAVPSPHSKLIVQLPSRKRPHAVQILSNEIEQRFVLRWQRSVLDYRNGLQIYVWQPHLRKEPEAYCTATVIIPAEKLNPKTQSRMLILLHPSQMRTELLEKQHVICPSTDTGHSWDARHEVFRVVMILYQRVREDSINFVEGLTRRIQETKMRGRKFPTRSKIQYFLHLDDCRRRAINDFQDNEATLEKIMLFTKSDDFCCQEPDGRDDALDLINGILEDLRYLRRECGNLASAIESARQDVMEQTNLAQGQRALVLTIAAALFVPMSFIASIFGMNVKDPLFPSSPSTKSSGTSSSSQQNQTATKTAGSTSNTPNQHYWDMADYFKLAFPLTAGVILLPLLIGPLVRLSVQTYIRYRSYWRITTGVTGVLWFITIWLSFAISEVCRARLHHDQLDDYDDYDTLSHRKVRMLVTVFALIYYALNYGVFGLFVTIKMGWAYKQKRGRRRWTLLWLLIWMSLLAEFVSTLSGNVWPFGLLPYICILLYWLFSKRSDVRKFFHRLSQNREAGRKKNEEGLPLNDVSYSRMQTGL